MYTHSHTQRVQLLSSSQANLLMTSYLQYRDSADGAKREKKVDNKEGGSESAFYLLNSSTTHIC